MTYLFTIKQINLILKLLSLIDFFLIFTYLNRTEGVDPFEVHYWYLKFGEPGKRLLLNQNLFAIFLEVLQILIRVDGFGDSFLTFSHSI